MNTVSFSENPELAKQRIRSSIEDSFEDGTEVPFFSLRKENAEYIINNNIIENLGYSVLSKNNVPYGVKFEIGRTI